jgi:nicotinamidase-related amidase
LKLIGGAMNKSALLVLDFINDIVHPDGKVATVANYVKENCVIDKANQAIQFARQKNIPIIFVKVGFSANYMECSDRSPVFGKAKQNKALQLNTWGTEFHESLDVKPQDSIIIKHRVNAFYATGLETVLRANQIDTLMICGVSTNMAVATTAYDAHDRDYRVILLEDASGAATRQIQDSTIELLARVGQIVKVAELKKL